MADKIKSRTKTDFPILLFYMNKGKQIHFHGNTFTDIKMKNKNLFLYLEKLIK